ncbi:hypothetical protein DFH07DRAFT_775275 [Mycena maculata]|uniref:Uncharacterized protein n=1 Tax=Mycena maculata TaxID=230809 RepID=A0AAD7IWK9_9AGAR|nr:hypothetical protein DFH07DRAFT_775275 [Mycena maculata]
MSTTTRVCPPGSDSDIENVPYIDYLGTWHVYDLAFSRASAAIDASSYLASCRLFLCGLVEIHSNHTNSRPISKPMTVQCPYAPVDLSVDSSTYAPMNMQGSLLSYVESVVLDDIYDGRFWTKPSWPYMATSVGPMAIYAPILCPLNDHAYQVRALVWTLDLTINGTFPIGPAIIPLNVASFSFGTVFGNYAVAVQPLVFLLNTLPPRGGYATCKSFGSFYCTIAGQGLICVTISAKEIMHTWGTPS